MHFLNKGGRRIQLKKLVKVSEGPGFFVIRRYNGKRTISVSANLNRRETTPMIVAKDLGKAIPKLIKDYPGVSFSIGGESKETQKSLKDIVRAGVISIFGIFIILVLMFSDLSRPFIIMSSIPLGLIGVILTFKILSVSLGFMALLGVVGLIGIVVNDSIVLVSFIDFKIKKEKMNLKEAVLMASKSRFRAVILTTFTTVAGLLPIAHGQGGDPFLKPMALAFAWGLLFATGITLVFIPCAYMSTYRIKNFIGRKFKKISFGN